MDRRVFLQTGLSLTLGSRLLAEVNQQKFDGAADLLAKACKSRKVDAAAIYVKCGSREFVRAFGTTPSVDAIFLLASITKPIAISAVMTLYDKNEFRLDDPVKKIIPEFRGGDRDGITIRQLLTHVSGLPDQLPENSKLRASHAPLADFIKGAIRTPLLFKPGSKYSYSSMAILLACEISQRITKLPISELVDREVIKPLGMRHSALGLGKFKLSEVMRCQVKGSAPESGSGDASTKSWDWNSQYWRQLGVPWGGAHGSVADVGRWLDAFLHPAGKLLKPETAKLMIQNHNAEGLRPRGLAFDVGKRVGPPASEATFGHTGSTGTLCWADPASDTTCVVLTTLPARAITPHPRDLAGKQIADAAT